jgi:hypothetical protein
MSNNLRCDLCHIGFRSFDTIYESPVFGDRGGVFHVECAEHVEAIIREEGTNAIAHILCPGRRTADEKTK